ncbi:type IV secretion system protein [Kribbella sp. DT2]|uniref:type IV secretion system protein n=1 Tax=Kribbella sp. DT2 TaxID=3393427 RepID=UPI003CFB1250
MSDVGNSAANSVWESFLKWTASGLGDLAATVFQTFSTGTTPRFDQEWWQTNLALIVTISLPLLVALFVLQCISAVVHREPRRLGRALVGAVIGTAGVPLAVAVISSCGAIADEISLAILGNRATADGMKRLTDISTLLTTASLGGFLLLAVLLALVALFALYFVLLFREVALVAFVVFAPIALASWTWSATRHWLRRWIEVVGALLFSKIAMAVVFALGLSATGAADQGNNPANLSTFLAGVLLVAMAAFAPAATFSFIHWAGDQGHSAARAIQQGSVGAAAARDSVDKAQRWGAEHFGTSLDKEDSPVVGNGTDGIDTDDAIIDRAEADATKSGDSGGSSSDGSSSPDEPVSGGDAPLAPAPTAPAADSGEGSTAIAVATSEVSVDAPAADNPAASAPGNESTTDIGEDRG